MSAIWIANDHGGFEMKVKILRHLKDRGIEVVDLGSSSDEIVRYPYYAAQVAAAVSGGVIDRGILLCSTGIGMSIIANKYPGVRAALCASPYEAKMTRAHNDANILCIGGRTLGDMLDMDIVDVWLDTEFMGDRHEISLSLIREAEAENMTGRCWNPGLTDMR